MGMGFSLSTASICRYSRWLLKKPWYALFRRTKGSSREMTKYVTQFFNWQVVERFEVAILSTIVFLRFLHFSNIQGHHRTGMWRFLWLLPRLWWAWMYILHARDIWQRYGKTQIPRDRGGSWVKGFFSIVGQGFFVAKAPPKNVEKKMKTCVDHPKA